ncbi:MAG: GDP-L-fucose synthase [Kiritimatiellia bacterium]
MNRRNELNRAATYFVAGHRGMVGAAILRALQRQGCEHLLTATHQDLDLINQASTQAYFQAHRPDVVIIAAAKVGGIGANSAANATFLYENIMIAANTIEAAYQAGVKRLLFLGSSCIYPRLAPQPISEAALLTGALEKTNEGYALAKISGLKLCEFYRRQCGVCYHSLMPTNLYGTGDNYDVVGGHVLPTMIRKFELARTEGADAVNLWGTGTPLREFLHVDDLAAACVYALGLEDPPDLMNVGSGVEITIRALAEKIQRATGCPATIRWDASKPDGTPRKLIDSSLLRSFGWSPEIDLESGIARTVEEYRAALAAGDIRLEHSNPH